MFDISGNGSKKTYLLSDRTVLKEIDEPVLNKYFKEYRGFRIPEILRFSNNSIQTAFIDGQSLIGSLSLNPEKILKIVESVLEFEKLGGKLEKKDIEDKAKSVKVPTGIIARLDFDKLSQKERTINHGDLSLSNVIEKDDEFYLIDFHMPYIESNIVDLSKLLMDIVFGWSEFCFGMQIQKKQKLQIIELFFSLTEHDFDNLFILSIIDLYRIKPYCKKTERVQFINNRIGLAKSQIECTKRHEKDSYFTVCREIIKIS